jgi:glycosyltransferase involved in cell wall biosynthesis
MRVAIAGPVDLPHLARLLDQAAEPTVPSGFGGPVIAALVAELSQRGHEVTLVTLSPGIDAPVRQRIGAVDVLIGTYRHRHRARDAFRHERHAVRDLLNSVDTDAVHAHWTYEFGLGALASRHPTLITVRDWAPTILRFQPDPYRMVRLLMQSRCLAKTENLTVVSPYIGDRLRRYGGRAATLVPNGLPTGSFAIRAPSRSNPVRRVLSVSSNFSRLKNVGNLLRAFPAVRRQLGDVELMLVGGDYEPGGRAERWARSRGLANGTVFAGRMPTEHILEAMDASDIFVAPTLEESFGMTVLEAMARGLPVVAGQSSGAVPWLLDFGRAGELVDVRRPEQIAHAVVQLAGDPDRRAHLGSEALDRARRFAWPCVVPSYEAQYERIALTPSCRLV